RSIGSGPRRRGRRGGRRGVRGGQTVTARPRVGRAVTVRGGSGSVDGLDGEVARDDLLLEGLDLVEELLRDVRAAGGEADTAVGEVTDVGLAGEAALEAGLDGLEDARPDLLDDGGEDDVGVV